MHAIEKISSGIKDMDPLLGGGFPKGNIITFYGQPGTGKTISSLFFLLEGVKKKEKTLYVTFDEGEKNLIRLANNLEIDIQKHMDEGLFIIRDFSRLVSELGFERSITSKINEGNISRVVVDSITTAVIESVSTDSSIMMKRFIRNLFKSLRNNTTTSIIISRDEAEYETAVGLSDCAVFFQPHTMGEQGLSSFTITKVRLSKHNRNMQYLDIRPGEIAVRQK